MGLAPTSRGAAPEPITFYVSTDGSDVFTGSLARNNRQKSDGPFATVGHARDVIRGLIQAERGKLARPVQVYVRGGTYFLRQPLILTPQDSGTADCPVIWEAYHDEKPVLSAGRPVRGWGKVTVNGHELWAAKVPTLQGARDTFHEIWVSDQRRLLARAPNEGFFRVDEAPDSTDRTPQEKGQQRFRFREGDLRNSPDLRDADVVVMSLWTDSHLPVESVDEAGREVRFTLPAINKLSPDDRYFIEGALSLLDSPGQWCFDRRSGTLYYYPNKGEGMISDQIIIPWHQQVLRLEGDPANGQFVEHVTFRGITFANSEWYLPPTMAGFGQAAVGVPGAVWGEGVRGCTFDSCTVTHAGNYGIELGRGCRHNRISYCTMTDLGAGGIKIGTQAVHLADADQTAENEISDCTISDCGKIFPSAIGIWLGQTYQNLLSHNDIHGLWYTGISIGWTWGYRPSLARDNIIEWNHVHHIGTPADGVEPILSDMGAIYTLGKEPGTVIRNNHFHDIAGLRYGGWGIYFDEGSTKIIAENNLVYRTTHGGLHQHYGAENIVRNNIFAFGRDAQIQRTRVEGHLSFTFEKNLVYWDRGALLAGDWSKLQVAFDNNTYWNAGSSEIKFAGRTWEQWRQEGMDRHSQIADPGFIDPAHGEFHLKGSAEQSLLGFTPFDVSSAGPRRHPGATAR